MRLSTDIGSNLSWHTTTSSICICLASAGQKKKTKRVEKRDRSNGNPKGRPPGTTKKRATKPEPAEPDNRNEAEVLRDLQATGFEFRIQGGRVWPRSPPRFEPQQPAQPAPGPPFIPRPEGPYWPYNPHVQHQPPLGPQSTQPFRPIIGYDQFGNPVFGHSAQHFSWDDALNGGTGYGPRPGPGEYNIQPQTPPRPAGLGPYYNPYPPAPRPTAPAQPNIYQTPTGQIQPNVYTPPNAPQGWGGFHRPAVAPGGQHIVGSVDENGSPRPKGPAQSGGVQKSKKQESAAEFERYIRNKQAALERLLADLNNNYGPRPGPFPAGPSVGASGAGSYNNASASDRRPGSSSAGSAGSGNNNSGSGSGNSHANLATQPPRTAPLQSTSSQPLAPPATSAAVDDWTGVFGGISNNWDFGTVSPFDSPAIAPPVTTAGGFSPIPGFTDPPVNMDEWTRRFTPPPSGERAAGQQDPASTVPVIFTSEGFTPAMAVTAGPTPPPTAATNAFDAEFDAGGDDQAYYDNEEEEEMMEGEEIDDFINQYMG